MLGLGLGLTAARRVAGPGTLLLGPGYLSPLVTFSRPSGATDINATGKLVTYGNDVARYGYDPATGLPAGWLIEGQATNLIRNPRAEGAVIGVVGSGGSLPTYWSLPGQTLNTVTVVGTGTEGGMPYIDLRFDASGAGNGGVYFEASSGAPYAASATYSGSVYARLIAGSVDGFNFIGLRNRVDTPVANNGPLADMASTLGSAMRRFTATTIPSSDAAAGRLNFTLVSTASASMTIRFAGPQLEQNYFASSLILPPVGAPAIVTRADDNLSITGSAFRQLFGAGAPRGCVILDVMLPQVNVPIGQHLLQIDIGAQSGRLQVYSIQNTADIGCFATVGGSATGTTGTITGVVAGAPFRLGLRWDGAGFGICKDGGAIQSAAASSMAGSFTALRLGNSFTMGTPINGRVQTAAALPYAPSDTDFRALCTPGYPL